MSTFTLKRARELREKQQQEIEQVEVEIDEIEQVEEVVVEEIEEHKEEEVEKDVFVCPHCNKEYKTERGLKNHIETKHKDGE